MLPDKDTSRARSETHTSPERRSGAAAPSNTTHSMPHVHRPQHGLGGSIEQWSPVAAKGPPPPLRPHQPQHTGIQSLLHAVSASLSGGESSTSMASRPPREHAEQIAQLMAPTPAPNPKRLCSPSPAAKRREGRPAYRPEEDDFIRFCRDDLCQSWECSTKLFNQTWHWDGTTQPRKIPGLQSRYYRLLEESVRDLKKATCGRPELGILEKTNRRYWWMTGAYTDEERTETQKCRHGVEAKQRSGLKRRRATSSTYSSEDEEEEEESEDEGKEDGLQELTTSEPPSHGEPETGNQDDNNPYQHMVPIPVSSTDEHHDLTDMCGYPRARIWHQRGDRRFHVNMGIPFTEPDNANLIPHQALNKVEPALVARRIKSRKRRCRGLAEEQSQGSGGRAGRIQPTGEGIDAAQQ